jgi:flagellar hook protein FlgE
MTEGGKDIMISPMNSSIAGIKALSTKLAVTANNVANIETEGFKKSRAVLEEAAPDGVTVTIERVGTPGSLLPADNASGQTRETSNVALEEEMINLITTHHAYEANLKPIKTWDEMMESVLDLFG